MTMTRGQDAPRYATLRDYLRVLRRSRLLIIVIAVAFAAAAYALTSREKVTYQASSSVVFEDTTQEVNLLGTPVVPLLPDVTRAQINAQTLTRAAVVQQVKAMLKSPLSIAALAGQVSTAVDSQTNVVVISALSSSPAYAQAVANAFAQAAQIVGRKDTRAQFAALAAGVQAQFARLSAISKDAFTRSVYANRISTLKFLADTADPVKIVQNAALPSTPVGPRTVRNTILGLLLGITIGLLAAFIRDALDRRLRATSDISDQLGWPIVGYVRESVFSTPAFGNGDGRSSADDADREAFRILRQNIRFLDVDKPPRSIVVTSALPEEGKSTVSSELACASVVANTRTLLVECDLRRPSLARRFGIERVPGLTDYLLGESEPADILQVVQLANDAELPPGLSNGKAPTGHSEGPRTTLPGKEHRLTCITAGRQAPETAELLGSARFKAFLRDVSAAYDLVILDGSPLLSVADSTMLLPEADATLICVRAGRTTQDAAAALKQAVERVPHGLTGIVVTGVRSGSVHDLGYYSYAYAYESAG